VVTRKENMSNEQRELELPGARYLLKKEKRNERKKEKEAKRKKESKGKEIEKEKVFSRARGRGRKKDWEASIDYADEELQAEWAAFQLSRQQMRKDITDISRGRFIMRLSRWTKERAIAALRYSTENGYQGIFEPPAERRAAMLTKPNLPWSMRERKINKLNERKAELMREEQTPRVVAELARIQTDLLDL